MAQAHPEHPLAVREPLSQANVAKAFDQARRAAFARRDDGEAARRDKNFRKADLREIARELVLEPPPIRAATAPEAPVANAAHPPEPEDADLIGEDDLEALLSAPPEAAEPSEPAPRPEPAQAAQPAAQGEAPAPAALPDEETLARLREEAYQEGFAAGRAISDSARETELTQRIVDLETLLARLADPGIIDMSALRTQIRAAVFRLASERAGQAIDDLPAPFLARLEAMLQSVAHLSGERDLFLAPADLIAVQEAVPEHARLSAVRLHSDLALARGDARLRVGGAEIRDLLGGPENAAPENAAPEHAMPESAAPGAGGPTALAHPHD